jgi:hypothetical protein
MRTVCLLLILVAACKDKQETKPSPPPPAPELKPQPTPTPTPAPAPELAKPAEPTQRVVKPAGGLNTPAEYEAKAFDLTDKLIAVFAGAGTNCEKLADNLEVFLDVNKAAIGATEAFETANPFAQDDLEPKLQGRVRKLVETSGVTIQKCGDHQRVQAALAKLPD